MLTLAPKLRPIYDNARQFCTQRGLPRLFLRPGATPHLRRGTREIGSFVFTTAVIFCLTFLALNFTAYQKQLSFLWQNAQASELQSSLLDAPILKTTMKLAPAQPTVQVDGRTLPALVTDVTPPTNYLEIERLGIRAPIREAENVDLSGHDWRAIEKQIQSALHDGVVHFPGTAKPGERGNAFITGHSSYYPWAPGRYKDIFAVLPQVTKGDAITIWEGQQKYVYRVSETREVTPDQTDVLAPTTDRRLTLMTCTPVGTALRRLIVTAQLDSNTRHGAEVAFAR